MIPLTTPWKLYNQLPMKQRVTLVTITNYARVFSTQNTRVPGQYPWIVKLEGGGYTVDDFSGWARRGGFTISVQDFAGLLSQDFTSTILDGQTVTITTGFEEMQQSDYITVATLQVEKVEPSENGNTYNIICRDLGIELDNPVYQTGDDGWPTGSNHTKVPILPVFPWTASLGYVVGDCVLGAGYTQLCTVDGVSGGSAPSWSTTIGNTTSDGSTLKWLNVGVSPQSPMALVMDILLNQIGYPVSRLNLTQMCYYIANLFPGLSMLFTLDSAPQAQEFLVTEIFKALFGFGFWNYAGQYTPHFYLAVAGPTPVLDFWDGVNTPSGGFTSGLGSSIQSPLPTETAGDYFTVVEYRMDYNGSDYVSELVSAFGTAEPFDLSREQVIQAKGLTTPLGGALYAQLVATTLFQRYGLRPALLQWEADWTAICLEPGDLVSVSHPLIKNKLTGATYLSHELFQVRGITPNWETGTVSVTGIDVNYLQSGPYKYAANGTSPWTSGGAATTNMYIAGSGGTYSDGTPGRLIYP